MGDFNFKIPIEIHQDFKIAAIKAKKDMRDILVELIKKFNKENQ